LNMMPTTPSYIPRIGCATPLLCYSCCA
jgi:hypothetical protein